MGTVFAVAWVGGPDAAESAPMAIRRSRSTASTARPVSSSSFIEPFSCRGTSHDGFQFIQHVAEWDGRRRRRRVQEFRVWPFRVRRPALPEVIRRRGSIGGRGRRASGPPRESATACVAPASIAAAEASGSLSPRTSNDVDAGEKASRQARTSASRFGRSAASIRTKSGGPVTARNSAGVIRDATSNASRRSPDTRRSVARRLFSKYDDPRLPGHTAPHQASGGPEANDNRKFRPFSRPVFVGVEREAELSLCSGSGHANAPLSDPFECIKTCYTLLLA